MLIDVLSLLSYIYFVKKMIRKHLIRELWPLVIPICDTIIRISELYSCGVPT